MIEEWKDIQNYEGLYQISNTGMVKSVGRYKQNNSKTQWIEEKIMIPNNVGSGYLQVALYKDGIKKNAYIHRLVGTHFIENPFCRTEINHKDENKHNNKCENLEWCTRSYNNTFGTKIARAVMRTDYKKMAAKTDYKAMNQKAILKRQRSVAQIDKNGNLIKIYESATIAANENGFNQSDICSCCKGKLKTAKGYRWKYAE